MIFIVILRNNLVIVKKSGFYFIFILILLSSHTNAQDLNDKYYFSDKLHAGQQFRWENTEIIQFGAGTADITTEYSTWDLEVLQDMGSVEKTPIMDLSSYFEYSINSTAASADRELFDHFFHLGHMPLITPVSYNNLGNYFVYLEDQGQINYALTYGESHVLNVDVEGSNAFLTYEFHDNKVQRFRYSSLEYDVSTGVLISLDTQFIDESTEPKLTWNVSRSLVTFPTEASIETNQPKPGAPDTTDEISSDIAPFNDVSFSTFSVLFSGILFISILRFSKRVKQDDYSS